MAGVDHFPRRVAADQSGAGDKNVHEQSPPYSPLTLVGEKTAVNLRCFVLP
jgi:hypothetical protein